MESEDALRSPNRLQKINLKTGRVFSSPLEQKLSLFNLKFKFNRASQGRILCFYRHLAKIQSFN